MIESGIWIYVLFLLAIWLVYGARKKIRWHSNALIHEEAVDVGLTEPASLHPVIDPSLCLGCGACVKACPERDKHAVLGVIDGKAVLVEPTNCIGHGACKTACPFDAITLVFGSEKRGVDIPTLDPDFQTSVPGIYIAGELGGMGLIRNAVQQGSQAIDAIDKKIADLPASDFHDVVIVGAGPAGFAATLRAKELNLNYLTLEQDSLGGSVFQYPRGKLVMTAPVNLPIVGKCKFSEVSKEELLAFWQKTEIDTDIQINYREKILNIEPVDSGFRVATEHREYFSKTVLLAIGRRGTPRKLGVTGEELPKVVYRMIDPAQYRNQHVLVVGGGDSALEAAAEISDQDNTTVTLSYRSDAFGRAKKRNRVRIQQAQEAGRLTVHLKSNVLFFSEDSVILSTEQGETEFHNDAAIVCAGGILPDAFLKQIGISVETKFGTE